GGDSVVEIRAWHLEQACLLSHESPPVDAAVAALTAAGEKAERREGNREADRFYERALALLSADAEQALELRLNRARLLVGMGDHGAARKALLPLAQEAAERGSEHVRAGALVALANLEWKLGLAEESRGRLHEVEAYARRVGDTRLGVRAAFERAF